MHCEKFVWWASSNSQKRALIMQIWGKYCDSSFISSDGAIRNPGPPDEWERRSGEFWCLNVKVMETQSTSKHMLPLLKFSIVNSPPTVYHTHSNIGTNTNIFPLMLVNCQAQCLTICKELSSLSLIHSSNPKPPSTIDRTVMSPGSKELGLFIVLREKTSMPGSAVEFEKFFTWHIMTTDLPRLWIHGELSWIVKWLVLCVSLTGHGVPWLNLISECMCECFWMRLAFELVDPVR